MIDSSATSRCGGQLGNSPQAWAIRQLVRLEQTPFDTVLLGLYSSRPDAGVRQKLLNFPEVHISCIATKAC